MGNSKNQNASKGKVIELKFDDYDREEDANFSYQEALMDPEEGDDSDEDDDSDDDYDEDEEYDDGEYDEDEDEGYDKEELLEYLRSQSFENTQQEIELYKESVAERPLITRLFLFLSFFLALIVNGIMSIILPVIGMMAAVCLFQQGKLNAWLKAAWVFYCMVWVVMISMAVGVISPSLGLSIIVAELKRQHDANFDRTFQAV